MKRMRWMWSVVLLGSGLGSGCATPSVTGPAELPLRRVAVYRNGVGYFERGGKVHADRLQFKVKSTHVGDFLATLAVMEKGGSSLKAASFPLHLEHPPTPATPGSAPDPQGLEKVVLELDEGEHDVAVGYVTEQPVWKPSYRLVLRKDGATLQAWGVVQNLSGEDWNDVKLSLVAGAPIAFRSTLQTPVTPQRPAVNDTGEVISAVPTSVSTLAQRPPPPPPSMVMSGLAGAAPMPSRARREAKMDAPAAAAGLPSMDMEEEASASGVGTDFATSAVPRNLSALAAQTVEGGATRYDLPQPVTVPNDSATMVLLMAKEVKGESVFMFAPEGGVPESMRHPFRVARFTNGTSGLLERGPIAVYEASSFLGQGVMEPLSAGGEATVPFALERALAVDVEQRSSTEDARLFHIEHGSLQLERDQVTRTRYKIRNGGSDDAKVVVRHQRQSGSRLHDPPQGTEEQLGQGIALVPLTVKARGTGELVVDERRGYPMSADWLSPEADQAVKGYLSDKRADAKVASVLRAAWQIREALVQASRERDQLRNEQAILQNASVQTRESLKAIARNEKGVEDLRSQLSARLAELDGKLATVSKRLVELELGISERQVRFTETVRDLVLAQPLPQA